MDTVVDEEECLPMITTHSVEIRIPYIPSGGSGHYYKSGTKF